MFKIGRILTLALLLVGVLVISAPGVAQADRSNCKPKIEQSYSHYYKTVAHKFGKRQPGRHIRDDGMRVYHKSTKHYVVRDAKCREVRRSLRTFKRWLAPPPAPIMAGDTSSANNTPPSYAGGNYSIPSSIVMCESGGNYNAYNPSGARGAYQIMPGTHASICPDLSWSPPDQDTCAGRIWNEQGRGAWVC